MATSAKTDSLQSIYNSLVSLKDADQKEYDIKKPQLDGFLKEYNDALAYFQNPAHCNSNIGGCVGSWQFPSDMCASGESYNNTGSAYNGKDMYNAFKGYLQCMQTKLPPIESRVGFLKQELDGLPGRISQAYKDLQDSITYDNTQGLPTSEKAILAKAQNYKTALTVGIIIVILLVGIWVWNKYFRKGA